MKTHIIAGAFALSTIAVPAGAQTIIAPTSGVIDAGGPGFGTLTETFNQAGLSTGYTSGVTDFDTYMAGNPTHTSIFSGFEWFSESGTTAATVTYDFGATVTVDRLALWNEETSGIGRLILSGSLDGMAFTQLGIYSPTDNPLAAYPADIFSFTAASMRYVRFDMAGCPQANPGTFSACAIGEVAFRTAGAVPEPATWGLMILGFGAIGGAKRRRAVRTTLRTA